MTDEEPPRTASRWLLAVPAMAVGLLAAATLWIIDEAAELLHRLWWDALPRALGIAPEAPWWIFGVLTLTGVLIGLIRWRMPGRGGLDSATVEMAQPPQALGTLPSIAVAAAIMLAGGVSLGPEAPVIAIVVALAVWALSARWRLFAPADASMIAIAATIGALFGTPVAAALLLTSAFATVAGKGALWDRLVLPLAAAASGSLLTLVLGGGIRPLPGFGASRAPTLVDLVAAVVVALAAAALGIVSAWALPLVHRALRRWPRHPFLVPAVGGVVLGLLGALGGPLTLFKGLGEGATLISQAGTIGVPALIVIVGVKILAVVVSAAASFPGGRIFPAVFIGLATGVLAATLVPAVSLPVGVAAGVLGYVIAVSHDGWLALFAAIAIVGDVGMLPMLCIAVLPVWLVVTRAPEMIVHERPAPPAST